MTNNNENNPTFPRGRFGMSGRGGRGRQPGGFGLGPGGECWCPRCGKTLPHQRGVPCYQMKCPECGQPLTRKR